jgi:type II secretory pathway pseudopilin PulG
VFLRRLSVFLFLSAFILISVSPGTGQTRENSSPSSAAKSADVSGRWQVSWQGRLGTEQCTLQLQQDSSNKLSGTLQDQRGSSSLSGTIDGKKISFDVQFQGLRPFTTRFTGTVGSDKIEGTSQAIGVGGAGAYLGHAGEVVQPEHPWTAKRVTNQPVQPPTAGSNPNPPAKN